MATINLTNAPFETMLDAFAKTISRIPVTKTTDNFSGDETLTDGSAVDIQGAFYRKEDMWMIDKEGLLEGSDAILLVKDDVTINKDDKLVYDNKTYRVQDVIKRRLGTTQFYTKARCFEIG